MLPKVLDHKTNTKMSRNFSKHIHGCITTTTFWLGIIRPLNLLYHDPTNSRLSTRAAQIRVQIHAYLKEAMVCEIVLYMIEFLIIR